jgi:hypothetical protein
MVGAWNGCRAQFDIVKIVREFHHFLLHLSYLVLQRISVASRDAPDTGTVFAGYLDRKLNFWSNIK